MIAQFEVSRLISSKIDLTNLYVPG